MEPIFERSGDLYVPTQHAVGPWAEDALHGGAPAALVLRAVGAREGMAVVRATYDFLGPVPLAPLTVTVTPLREGRRMVLLGVTIGAGEREALHARVMLLRTADVDVGGAGAPGDPPPAAGPEAGSLPFTDPEAAAFTGRSGFATSGMELRFVEGDFFASGPAAAWFRFARPLVDDSPATAVETAAAAGDFTNGYGHEVAWNDWMFANVDLTVHLWRTPAGEWIGARGGTTHGPDGAAVSRGVLFDADGAVGTAAQSLFVAPSNA